MPDSINFALDGEDRLRTMGRLSRQLLAPVAPIEPLVQNIKETGAPPGDLVMGGGGADQLAEPPLLGGFDAKQPGDVAAVTVKI